MRILVVDDEEDARVALEIILASQGHNVNLAINGIDALNILEQEQFDLIITDILMPEMDGIELVQKAKQGNHGLKVILISGGGRQLGSAQYDYLSVGQKLTATQHVLKKPFPPQDLIKLLEEIIGD